MTKDEFNKILTSAELNEFAILHESISSIRESTLRTLVMDQAVKRVKVDILYLMTLANYAQANGRLTKTKSGLTHAELIDWLNRTNALQNKVLNVLAKTKNLGLLSRVLPYL